MVPAQRESALLPRTTSQSTDGFLAFFDVLGFGQIVTNNLHETLWRKYELLMSQAQLAVSRGRTRVVVDDLGNSLAVADLEDSQLNFLLSSDSAILWTPTQSMKAFVDILASSARLMVSSFHVGLPLRAAIAAGSISFVNHSSPGKLVGRTTAVIGRPLVEAHDSEARQAWAGCVVLDECIKRYRQLEDQHRAVADLATLEYLQERHLVRSYNVPFREGYRDSWVVDWPWWSREPPSESLVRDAFRMHGRRVDTPEMAAKIEETAQFLRASLSAP